MAITLSFCWCFAPDIQPETGLAMLKQSGFEAIELWPDALLRFGVQRWKRALRDAGMTCAQLCPYFDFVHGEHALWKSRAMLREYLDAARELACTRIRTFTGPPWGDHKVGPRQATDAQWAAAIAGLQEFCDQAAAVGVELCLECHEGSLMEDSPSTLRLLRGVQRRNLTVNLQLPLENEPWQTSVEHLGSHCPHIHFHRWTEGFGIGQMTWLSSGKGDWTDPVRRILAANGGNLCLSLEHGAIDGRDAAETARRDGPWLVEFRRTVSAP